MRARDVKRIPMALLASLFGSGKGEHALDEETWLAVMGLPLFDGLAADGAMRACANWRFALLADKAFSGAGDIEVDDGMATAIAAFAVLPVLNIGYDWYEGWREIVVYPGEFIYDGEQMDEIGVVHHVRHVRSGEAMQGGPMVLSWQDVEHSGQGAGLQRRHPRIRPQAGHEERRRERAAAAAFRHSPGGMGARFSVCLRRPLPPRGRWRRHGDRPVCHREPGRVLRCPLRILL